MKRILSTLIFVFSIIALYGQITLQHTYNYSTAVVKLETLGYKYYLMDVPTKQVRIYNMDHSLFKTINCTVPNGYFLSDIKFVSENLFNSDSQIELAYTYYKYVSTSTSYYYIYGAKVITEDGTVLQPIDGAQYLYVNKTGDTEYKLFAYCFDYSVFPEKVWTVIYNLPGKVYSFASFSAEQPDLLLKSYPNPATDLVTVNYDLPANVGTGKLYLMDNSGRAVSSYIIDQHTDHLELNVGGLSDGVYHYFIEYGNTRSESKKMVVR